VPLAVFKVGEFRSTKSVIFSPGCTGPTMTKKSSHLLDLSHVFPNTQNCKIFMQQSSYPPNLKQIMGMIQVKARKFVCQFPAFISYPLAYFGWMRLESISKLWINTLDGHG
jgi:hypothetical protein